MFGEGYNAKKTHKKKKKTSKATTIDTFYLIQ